MIDRAARKQMSAIIRSYLDEEIGAFKFDAALQELAEKTKDKTVDNVAWELWHYYDDFIDHKVHATKEQWDYFHRFLFLLESEGDLEIEIIRKWSLRQLVAVGAFVVFLLVAFNLGWGEHLFAVSIPFGFISFLISFLHSKATYKPNRMEITLAPFSSFHELLSVRRKVAIFHKKPYPVELTRRKRRHFVMDRIMWLSSTAIWLMFAPVPLLFQAMPETVTKMKVKINQLDPY